MLHARRAFLVTLGFCVIAGVSKVDAQSISAAPYKDSTLAVGVRVNDLVKRMTVDEKFWQLFMIPGDLDNPAHDYSHGAFGLQISARPSSNTSNTTRSTRPIESPSSIARAHAVRINSIQKYFVEQTRLGIPIIPFEEALHGLGREGATSFPQAIALAASFDTTLMSQVATAISRESRNRGIRDLLSPVINIANDVRWGRVEETYGEDPYLTSAMARAYVGTVERAGIVATPKHFIANVGDGGRDSHPIDFSERLLDEVFYPPFLSSIRQAGARSVMSAYNSIDGSPASQNRALLTGKLKQEWGFTGFVISDAAATGGATVLHHTEASTATATKNALEAGLDVIFQSTWEQHRPYLDAFKRGLIADSVIDAAVSRVLRAKFELGLFERPYANPDSAAKYHEANADHRALAREAARKSIVLMRNEGSVLPIKKTVRSIALIGNDADEGRLGGYSTPDAKAVSIREAFAARAKNGLRVKYLSGPDRIEREYVPVAASQLSFTADGKTMPGLRAEYFNNNALTGVPTLTRTDAQVDFGWTLNSPGRGIPFDWYSVRWTGTVTIPTGGIKQLGVEGNDGYRLFVDGKLFIDNWRKQSYGHRLKPVAFAPGSKHEIRLEYFESTGNARVKLVWDAGIRSTWRARIDSAVIAARQSDFAIVVAGIEEGEFRDRSKLALPGHQEELIQRVAATGKPVVVVLVGGSAITMSSWIDRVSGIVDVWYPGIEGGNAVADVLFGDANPAGRLPITFPVSEGQVPLVYNHKPTGRGDDYLDGTGHPLFPFGFGLSYTTFAYSALQIVPAGMLADRSAQVRCRVTNTGTVAGDEVVQLYVRDILASVARPISQLAGFARVHLEPGESQDVLFNVGPEHLRMLDRDRKWIVEPGVFRITIGSSSRDIRLRGELVVEK